MEEIMAFGYYMNMERIALDIAREHIENMTDDNMEDDIFLFIVCKTKPKIKFFDFILHYVPF